MRIKQCPHCLVRIHAKPGLSRIGEDADGSWCANSFKCPACERIVIFLTCGKLKPRRPHHFEPEYETTHWEFQVFPRANARQFPPGDVPEEIAEEYIEAASVLNDSPRASAALSRRCLQHVLKDAAGATHNDLSKQIDFVLQKNELPSHLSKDIDAIRSIGNFAAHPIKSTTSGEIVDVELGEAEWTLDVLDGLFDFYYVQPKLAQARRDRLNEKLKDADRKPLKGPPDE